jgi:hypothetical protein
MRDADAATLVLVACVLSRLACAVCFGSLCLARRRHRHLRLLQPLGKSLSLLHLCSCIAVFCTGCQPPLVVV